MVDNRAENNTGDPESDSEASALSEAFETYIGLSTEAYASGDRELGERLSRYAFEILDKAEEREAVGELEAAWPRFQEMLLSGQQGAKLYNGPARASTITLPNLRAMLGIDSAALSLRDQSEDTTTYETVMRDGFKYVEVHDSHYGSVSAYVERQQQTG